MRVYIAGNPHDHDRYAFEQAARRLAADDGTEVFSLYHPALGLDDPAAWTQRRIDHILGCDVVVTLPGGMAGMDELFARAAGVPVRGLDDALTGSRTLAVA